MKRLSIALFLLLASCATQGEPNPYIAASLLNMLLQAQQPQPRHATTTLCRQTDIGLLCNSF